MMQVSHETIYQSLFVQGRGELRRELARCLRSGRTARRHQGRVEKRGKNPNMVMITERPRLLGPCGARDTVEDELIVGAAAISRGHPGRALDPLRAALAPAKKRPWSDRRRLSGLRVNPPVAEMVADDLVPLRRPGIKGVKWPSTWSSPWPPASPSTSAIPIRLGVADQEHQWPAAPRWRCPRAPTSTCTAQPICSAFSEASTGVLASSARTTCQPCRQQYR